MNKPNILVFKLPELFKILNELKEYIEFEFYSFSNKDDLLDFKKKTENYLILLDSKNEIKNEKFQLVLEKFPNPIVSIIEKINIALLKRNYSEKSNVIIGNYSIDINSRIIKNNKASLKLTEREIEIIIFLNKSISAQNIENLQKEVWGHNSNLETHTVETHIYRLRKKILEKFNDSNFIKSLKAGYSIWKKKEILLLKIYFQKNLSKK